MDCEQIQLLKEKYSKVGQGHVFRFEDKLDNDERKVLYKQLREIDVTSLGEKHAKAAEDGASPHSTKSSECVVFALV
jgi:hypothetical protein